VPSAVSSVAIELGAIHQSGLASSILYGSYQGFPTAAENTETGVSDRPHNAAHSPRAHSAFLSKHKEQQCLSAPLFQVLKALAGFSV